MISQAVGVTSAKNIGLSVQPGSHELLMTPKEIDCKNWMLNYAYSSYLSDLGSWETRGTPQHGMTEYSTECRDISKVFSYQEGKNEEEDWIIFGELKDGSVFKFSGGCNYTGFDCQGEGEMIVAPSWENLFDNLTNLDLRSFVKNMSKDNSPELKKSLSEKLAGDEETLIVTLKEIFYQAGS